jgi:hypothetical protein
LNTGGYIREITRGWYVGSRCKGYTGDVFVGQHRILRLLCFIFFKQIGVICLYKAQVHSLLEKLSQSDLLDGPHASGISTAGLLVQILVLLHFSSVY